MKKKLVMLTLTLFVTLSALGCENIENQNVEESTKTAYDLWRESLEARDYTGNRRIDEADYEIYLRITDFDYWLNSDGAMDYNGDRRINRADHDIFILLYDFEAWLESDEAEDLNDDGRVDALDHTIFRTQNDFEFWLNSSKAMDLNDDGRIDILDFEIYQNFLDVAGSYRLTNYQYIGQRFDYFLVNNTEYILGDLGNWLTQLTFNVDFNGSVTVTISEELERELRFTAPLLLEFVSNASINRISRFIIVLDTFVTVSNNKIDYTFYFESSEQGFKTSLMIDFPSRQGEMSFEIIRVD